MVSAPGTKHQAPSAQALLREGTRRLREAGCESPDRDAEWLLGHLLNQKPTALYLHEAAVSEEIAAKFLRDIVARASGAPVQYLTGEAEFFGRNCGNSDSQYRKTCACTPTRSHTSPILKNSLSGIVLSLDSNNTPVSKWRTLCN